VKHEPLVSARFDSVLATAMDITEGSARNTRRARCSSVSWIDSVAARERRRPTEN